MNARHKAVRRIGKTDKLLSENSRAADASRFELRLFHKGLIEELPKEAGANWLQVLEGRQKFDASHAEVIAEALKSWAVQQGATHYTYWFQSLADFPLEKQYSFLSFGPNRTVLEQFSAEELLGGKTHACNVFSDFSGENEEINCIVWDPTVLPFLWEGGGGTVLCIPAVSFSQTGEALSPKTALLRSEEKLNLAVSKLCKRAQIQIDAVFSKIGIEREYFLVDKTFYSLRPDLVSAGRAVFGVKSKKVQELADSFIGSQRDRIMAYMYDYEKAALEIGILVKTRQIKQERAAFVSGCISQRASLAIHYNMLLMQVMQSCSLKHDLICLLQDNPLGESNDLEKNMRWSIETDSGLNLFDPQENGLVFLTVLTAVLRALHEHSSLFKTFIASTENGSESESSGTSPGFLSVDLGTVLEKLVHDIAAGDERGAVNRLADLEYRLFALRENDKSERKRDASFVYRGNHFEFRSVGFLADCGLFVALMNGAFAYSLELILDEIGSIIGDRYPNQEELFKMALPILRRHLKPAQKMLVTRNTHSSESERGELEEDLGDLRANYHPYLRLIDKKSILVFEGILSERELQKLSHFLIKQDCEANRIELSLMIEIFQTQILPAAQKDMKQRGIDEPFIGEAISINEELKKLVSQIHGLGWEAKAKAYAELAVPRMKKMRKYVDQLERIVDISLWPFPKYAEMLFLI